MINYILTYYQAIQDGTEVVGKWVRLWYERIVRGIEDKTYTYSQKHADRAIRFIEAFCRHCEGALAPGHVKLELWQKAFIAILFGVLDEAGKRQFREVLLEIGRKNGKTLLAAGIALYMTYLDGEYGAKVYFCAPKLDQARLCFDAYHQMILAESELSGMARKRRTDIYVAETNSSAQPLAFNAKKSDGLNPHLAVCDELAAWQGEAGLKQYEVLKSALGARRQPLILCITTAGYVNDGIFDEMIRRSTAVLLGTSEETRLCPLLYTIDDIDKWDDINELRKANPNLGVSVSVDYMLEEIAVARGSLSKKVEFLVKYCNVKQNSASAWLDAQTVGKAFAGPKYTLADFRDTYAVGGIDLSRTTDLTACVLMVERGGVTYTFARFFLPRERLEEATARDGIPYEQYVKKGYLILSGENVVDYQDCANWFKALVEEHRIYPLMVGYDRYSAQYLVQDMQAYGFQMESVSQGSNLTGVINDLEGALKDGRLVSAEDNGLLKIHMLDSAVKVEAETFRRRLIKVRSNAHVDGVAAMLDAMCMRYVHWESLGDRLTNGGG